MHLCSELQCTTLRFIEQKAEKGQKRKEQSESITTRAFRRSNHFIHISESPFLMVLHYPAHVFTKKERKKSINISFWICLDYQLLYNWKIQIYWENMTRTNPNIQISSCSPWPVHLQVEEETTNHTGVSRRWSRWKSKCFQGGWEERGGPVSGGREDELTAVSEPQMGLVFHHVSVGRI